MRKTIPTISIRQPHAWAIMAGVKNVEFRSKPTRYRGPVLVHAGKSEQDLASLDQYLADRPDLANPTLYFGCLLGVVDLTDCRLLGKGDFGLVLANPRPIEPVIAKGKLAMLYETDVADLARRFSDVSWLLML